MPVSPGGRGAGNDVLFVPTGQQEGSGGLRHRGRTDRSAGRVWRSRGGAVLNDAMDCRAVQGNLKQIDAGDGSVYGVATNGSIWRLSSDNWENVPGEAIHASVGPAGVWCVNKWNYIYKLQDEIWVQVAGLLKQIDAGGNKLVAGVNSVDAIYCLNQAAVLARPPSPAWVNIAGSLKYYSCGSLGCWGINSLNMIYYRTGTSANVCWGSTWINVQGTLVMVEAGMEGTVYGINTEGAAVIREGVTAATPMGTKWTPLDFCSKFKSLSYDSGTLWLVTDQESIFKCQASKDDDGVL